MFFFKRYVYLMFRYPFYAVSLAALQRLEYSIFPIRTIL